MRQHILGLQSWTHHKAAVNLQRNYSIMAEKEKTNQGNDPVEVQTSTQFKCGGKTANLSDLNQHLARSGTKFLQDSVRVRWCHTQKNSFKILFLKIVLEKVIGGVSWFFTQQFCNHFLFLKLFNLMCCCSFKYFHNLADHVFFFVLIFKIVQMTTWRHLPEEWIPMKMELPLLTQSSRRFCRHLVWVLHLWMLISWRHPHSEL